MIHGAVDTGLRNTRTSSLQSPPCGTLKINRIGYFFATRATEKYDQDN